MKVVSVIAAASAALLAASGAQATTFLLSFSFHTYANTSGLTLDATSDGGGQYTVTSVSGDIDGLPASLIAPGGDYNDNLVFYPGTPATLDFDGLAFSTASGGVFGVYYYATSGVYEIGCQGGGGCGGGFGGSVDSFSLTEVTSSTPEPAIWALMLVGFAGLGAALRSRRKLASV